MKYVGLNIQFPISQLILSGEKTIETRTYPIPKKYIGQTLLFIETPGPKGKFKSRIVAKIKFGESFLYSTKSHFMSDFVFHRVDENSKWTWKENKPKWGWPIKKLQVFSTPKKPNKRIGIKYTVNLEI